jgi:DNA-binding LacI/PurR family transcriptional regulator
VIVGVGPSNAQLAGLAAASIPVVLVDPVIPPPDDVASVGSTNWAGGYSAGQHLTQLGHRRIGIVDGGPGFLYSSARVDGFRSALREAGVDLPDPFVAHGDWLRSRAFDLAVPMLSLSERPTGIFACSESMAFGVYDAAASLGLTIPGDLSVIGFDDLPEARWASPPMTTVQQPTADMGAVALNLLVGILSEERGSRRKSEMTRIELATQLIVRESTAAYRA